MTRTTLAMLTALAFIAIPTVHAAPGQGDVYIGLPHDVVFDIGQNEVTIFVGGQVECEEGFPAPSSIRVQLAPSSRGPDDGQGRAWTFEQEEWTVTWQPAGSGSYELEERIAVNVTGHGHGERGHAGEITVTTQPVQDETCSAEGLTVPARSGHAHASIGARPGEDAPTAFVGLIVLLAWIAGRRR